MPPKFQRNGLISLPESFAKVEIKNQDGCTKVFVNGNKVEKIRKIKFEQSAETIPCFEISTMGRPDIEIFGDISFDFTPKTTEEAFEVLQHEVKNSMKFRSEMKGRFMRALEQIEGKEFTEEILDEFIVNFFSCERQGME